MALRLSALLALPLVAGTVAPSPMPAGAVVTCSPPSASRPLPAAGSAGSTLLAPEPSSIKGSAALPPSGDYRQRLATTALGWPVLAPWCVWVEPALAEGPAARWEQRWLQAVEAALGRWQAVLPIQRVSEAEAAQVWIRRRRPPLQRDDSGRLRASNGRATLRLVQVQRAGAWQVEPRVEVLLSPDQRLEAAEATALHELGHAFGLWGHSDDPEDAMAAVPGARPVRELSRRDRATLRWLYAQPTRIGRPLPTSPGRSTTESE
jgi:predicted Zn-dependent protease